MLKSYLQLIHFKKTLENPIYNSFRLEKKLSFDYKNNSFN